MNTCFPKQTRLLGDCFTKHWHIRDAIPTIRNLVTGSAPNASGKNLSVVVLSGRADCQRLFHVFPHWL